MKAHHTPGPWRTNAKIPTLVEQTNAGQGINIICRCDDLDGDRSRAEDRANARLIAAAPDMLAALQIIADMDQAKAAWSAQDVARAAITKATGGA